MSWRSGGMLLADIWPAIESRIPDRAQRIEFTSQLLGVFVNWDVDLYDVQDIHPDIQAAIDKLLEPKKNE
jgi:hypothetical protein